jgi:hypothetical protein
MTGTPRSPGCYHGAPDSRGRPRRRLKQRRVFQQRLRRHHGVRPRVRKACLDVRQREDVTVRDHRHGDGLLHRPDRLPVREPLSLARARAAPNGCLIEAPWLVHGGHGASLRHPFGSPAVHAQQLTARPLQGARVRQRLLERLTDANLARHRHVQPSTQCAAGDDGTTQRACARLLM